ncbi:SRPBCC domain-containing protein [Bacillus testis]|uniref:SRPBCC domain-containing protein n=1 Tax=Bacillus testis TaxID=1622072 RepID=UPI00067E7E87|nr:SRPBCC domain-containing protein [Bacillus testis]
MTAIRSVKRNIFINASPQRIWDALTIPAERNKWETRACTIDLQTGGKIELDYGWGVSFSGKVAEIEVAKKLVIEDEEKNLTIWTITPEHSGSQVTITYTGYWSTEMERMLMENMLFGTYQFMRNLRSVLEESADIRHTFWKSWIGAGHTTVPYNGSTAIIVLDVRTGTPANGILQPGDLIYRLNGRMVNSYDDFETAVTEADPGSELTIEAERDGLPIQLQIRTTEYGKKTTSTL